MKFKVAMTEAEIQKSIVSYLELNKICVMRINTKGEFRRTGPGTGILCKNRNKGFSDLLLIHKGKAIFMEVKTKDGKISEDQSKFAEKVLKEGCSYFVVRCIEDVQICLRSIGVTL